MSKSNYQISTSLIGLLALQVELRKNSIVVSQSNCFSPLFFHPCIKFSTGQVSIRSGGSKVSSSVSLCIPSRVLTMAAKPDPYEGIDFDEICEATGLAVDEIKCLKVFHISVFRFFWRMKGG